MAIILEKGKTVDVKKEDTGVPIINLTVGAGWGKIARMGTSKAAGFLSKLIGSVASDVVYEDVDLDLSLIIFNDKKERIETCYFGNKRCFNGAIQHTGDDLVGTEDSDGADNERIKIQGAQIPANAAHIFVILNSYRHHKFDEIPFIGFSIYDGLFGLNDKAARLMEFRLDNDSTFKGSEAAIMARIDRTPKGFVVTPIGKPTADRSISELQRSCVAEL